MTFTRTAAGLANYSKFYNAQVIVFTEGKTVATATPDTADDQIFYESLLRHVMPGTTFKVKCVGNRSDALTYADKISKNGVKNEIVCIDRDLCGVTHSLLPPKCVVMTAGYSWENDLWTVEVAKRIINTLTHSNPPRLAGRFERLQRALRVLFNLDAALQVHSIALLKKSSRTGGINFTYSASQPVSLSEVKRLILLYRASPAASCPVSSSVLSLAAMTNPERIIQGHIWSNALRGLLMTIYREQTRDSAPTHRLLLNLALTALRDDAPAVLDATAYAYYTDSVTTALA